MWGFRKAGVFPFNPDAIRTVDNTANTGKLKCVVLLECVCECVCECAEYVFGPLLLY